MERDGESAVWAADTEALIVLASRAVSSSGVRVGETMLLRWADLDLDRATLTIPNEMSKNRKGRITSISPHLAEQLAG